MSQISIFLADDHPVVRSGLKLIFETQPDLFVVGEADNGRDALQQIATTNPDIVIMDISMPALNGIEATRVICASHPNTRIIVLSMHGASNFVFRALKAGARGYLLKGAANNEILAAIRAVLEDRRYLSGKLLEQFGDKALQKFNSLDMFDPLDKLSAREREVLQLVVEGQSSAEIAEQLHLSIKTVETYRHRLMHKLSITDLPTLVKFAIQHGITPLE